MAVVAATPGSVLITCEYNPAGMPEGAEAGLAWAILHDNPILAWVVDESGAGPAKPVIIGTMPGAGPSTDPVLSPSWAQRDMGTIFVPDMARGSANEFFNFVAFNNGARRALYTKFADSALVYEYNAWATANPSLALKSPPNVAPEPESEMAFVRSGREAEPVA